MKTHVVRYFGMLSERRGLAEEKFATAAATASGLYEELNFLHGLGMAIGSLRVAVNDEFASWDRQLVDGDTVAFLPPMSGG